MFPLFDARNGINNNNSRREEAGGRLTFYLEKEQCGSTDETKLRVKVGMYQRLESSFGITMYQPLTIDQVETELREEQRTIEELEIDAIFWRKLAASEGLVTIPDGIHPGMTWKVYYYGQQLELTCPPNVAPGDKVNLIPSTHNKNYGVFQRLFAAFKLYLPNLRKLILGRAIYAQDRYVRLLLEHMPPQLSALTIEDLGSPSPLTLGYLGSLTHLTELTLFHKPVGKKRGVKGLKYFSPEDCTILAQSLRELQKHQQLRCIYITSLRLSSKECLEPLIGAIQSNPNLIQVDFTNKPELVVQQANNNNHVATMEEEEYALTQEQLDSLQCGPMISAVRRQYNVPNTTYNNTKEYHTQWIEAMIAVRHRTDLFHFFFSQLSPDLLVDKNGQSRIGDCPFGDDPNLTFRQLAGLPPL